MNRKFNFKWGSKVYDTIVPQIRNLKNNYLTDKDNWTRISGFYLANGFENVLTVSSFNKSFETEILDALTVKEKSNRNRYYYVDDIYVGSIPKNLIYMIPGIAYNNDEYKIQEDILYQLNIIAKYLIQNTNINIQVIGYTDNNGSEKYNIDLSNRRAKEIEEYLVKFGVEASRIHIKGMGSKNPISTNQTEIGRKANRRVEIRFFN